ncbi:MAG: response regulator [Deltaproteobacteria bacterium]|nr:response regulator [Deltaproteobacteria bacterium]
MTRDALTLVRRTIGEHITVAELAADDVSLVNADPSQVEQMVLNLALNARDAMPRGGTLTFAIHAAHGHGGSAEVPGDWTVLEVSDTGMGMDEATRERIFEPFFTTKPAGHGTGLGLPMVFGAMKQLGGFVEVDSGVGRGSTFRLYFPSVEGAPEADTTTVRGPVSPRAGRVLLVEDDPAVARVIGSMLDGAGFASATHLRPDAALEQWRPGEHDVVVTDVVMPGMTGPELVRKLREREPSLRALLVTGYASHGDVVPTEPGRTGLLTKPFRRADLLVALGELLGDAAAPEDAPDSRA